jgi:predicted DNA-binding transcriptional regulator YafY
MSTNKDALIRYKVLDKCFSNIGRRYFIDDLVRECSNMLLEIYPNSSGISRRQILYDINFMESAEGWSIDLKRIKDGKRVYYRYVDPSFSINNMPLNDIEINNLKSALDILSQFKGMPQFEWMNELLPKLKQGIVSENVSPTIMEFDSNKYLRGIDFLGELYNAIYYKKILSIAYQPFENEEPFEIIIHPYFLKQYNNRWFLFGYNPENNKYDWNLAIDRMVNIKEIKGKYQQNDQIDWQEYFVDIIGVTKPFDAEPEKVVLQFKGRTGNYMVTKPLHNSQKKPKRIDDNTIEISLELIINYELERLVLSYADSVKVIKPEYFANTIKNRLENGLKQYE